MGGQGQILIAYKNDGGAKENKKEKQLRLRRPNVFVTGYQLQFKRQSFDFFFVSFGLYASFKPTGSSNGSVKDGTSRDIFAQFMTMRERQILARTFWVTKTIIPKT